MSDSFEVRGSFSVLVEGEIEKPNGWVAMTEKEKRFNIARQISNSVKYDEGSGGGIDPSSDVVSEVLETAEEMFSESDKNE